MISLSLSLSLSHTHTHSLCLSSISLSLCLSISLSKTIFFSLSIYLSLEDDLFGYSLYISVFVSPGRDFAGRGGRRSLQQDPKRSHEWIDRKEQHRLVVIRPIHHRLFDRQNMNGLVWEYLEHSVARKEVKRCRRKPFEFLSLARSGVSALYDQGFYEASWNLLDKNLVLQIKL